MYSLLILSFFSLCCGPILLQFAHKNNFSIKILDSFIVFSVIGLIVLHVLPECYQYIGSLALIFCFIGLIIPVLYEILQKNRNYYINNYLVFIIFLGLIAHSALDGFALFNAGNINYDTGKIMLGFAVVLHRIPEGFAIWKFTIEQGSVKLTVFTIFIVTSSTLGGFFLGSNFISHTSIDFLMVFQALMSGTLLHIIVHKDTKESQVKKLYNFFYWESSSIIGALLAVVIIIGITFL